MGRNCFGRSLPIRKPFPQQYLDGAECVNEPVVRDGNIITGMGPGAAMEFALTMFKTRITGSFLSFQQSQFTQYHRSSTNGRNRFTLNEPVVRDGNIITGMGPGAAMEFALTIVDLLVGKEKVEGIVSGGHFPFASPFHRRQ